MGLPQKKIIQQAGKFGMNNLIRQQGTTRHIWDTLELTPGTLWYRFFEGVNTRAFPLTNLTDNKLEVGESLVVQYMILSIVLKTTADGWNVVTPIPAEIQLGTISMECQNTIVMKEISLLPFVAAFNRMPNASGNVYKLFTDLTIMPLVPFTFPVHIPQLPVYPDATAYLRLTIKGTGAILSPKATQ